MSKISTARGTLFVVDNQGVVFRGAGHTGVIRAAGVVEGMVATGAEDGSVCLWRLVESRSAPTPVEPVHLGKMLGKSERDERRFRPY